MGKKTQHIGIGKKVWKRVTESQTKEFLFTVMEIMVQVMLTTQALQIFVVLNSQETKKRAVLLFK